MNQGQSHFPAIVETQRGINDTKRLAENEKTKIFMRLTWGAF